jgi:two-component system, chemotaxis family, CheB/CheR fusion protein
MRRDTRKPSELTKPKSPPSADRRDTSTRARAPLPKVDSDSNWNYLAAQKEFDRRLLSKYAPATVFVSEDMDIVHTRGNVNRYLKLAPGRASFNLMRMARGGLWAELPTAIARAKKEKISVGKRNLQITDRSELANGKGSVESTRFVNFEVVPLTLANLKELYFMIVFQNAPPKVPSKGAGRRSPPATRAADSSRQMAALKQELEATKEYLQSIVETQEATNEECTVPIKRCC